MKKRFSRREYEEFYNEALETTKQDKHYRLGQALFNNLCDVIPDLAEKVRGTENDPFFASDPNDPRILNFQKYVTWYTKQQKRELQPLTGMAKANASFQTKVNRYEKVIAEQVAIINRRKKKLSTYNAFIRRLIKTDRITEEELENFFKERNTKL